MSTRSTLFQKPTIQLDQDKYEQLIKTETRYNQLFNSIYNSFDKSDELMELLEVIDIEKYNQLNNKPQMIIDELIEEPVEEIEEIQEEIEESDNVTNGEGESVKAENDFRVGDIVEIIGKRYGHGFEIGEKGRIIFIGENDYKVEYLDGHDYWFLRKDEFKLSIGGNK